MIETDESDLDRVYGNLMAGSENHLRAFAGLIENLTGVPYEADPPTDPGTRCGVFVCCTGFEDVDLAVGVAAHDDRTDDLEVVTLGGLERLEVLVCCIGIRVRRYVENEIVT